MKYNNIKNLVLLFAIFLVAATGCKKTDFAINTNPDDITASTVDYRTVLPTAQTVSATIIDGGSFKFLQNWMGYWARSGSFQDITDEETYTFDNDFNVAVWNNLYSNATNYDFVAQKAKANGAGAYEAIGRIMRSLNFQMLVDVYGNIPYKQALQGTANTTPAYDKAEDIYKDLLRQCDTAIALLKDPILGSADRNGNLATNDLIYKGNATLWIKFANTFKLRLLIHAYRVTNFDIAGEIAIINAEGTGFINSASEQAILNPGYEDTKPTPFYRAYVKTEAGITANLGNLTRANAYSVGPFPYPNIGANGYYQWTNDPRLARLYVPSNTGQRGIPYGELALSGGPNEGSKTSTIDGPGHIPNGSASRAWILTATESLFLQAEARERNIITGGTSARELLRQAITSSFVWFNAAYPPIRNVANTADSIIFTPEFSADSMVRYNATYPDVDYDGVSQGAGLPAGGIYTILSQKWFAMNGINVLEIWTDFRRTDVVYGEGGGFAPGPPISFNPGNSKSEIPNRLFYPQNEYNYNAANVAAEGTIKVFPSENLAAGSGRIFWDVN
jgi:hypothetical protein